MARPTSIPNRTKILTAIQYNLSLIDNAHGFYTNGLVVDCDRDPRPLLNDRPAEFANKCAAVSVRWADRVIDGKPLSVTRWTQLIQFWCVASLTQDQDRAKRKISDIETELQEDLVASLTSDSDLKLATAALHTQFPSLGYDQTSCIYLHMKHFAAAPAANYFPNTFFMGIAQVQFDVPRGKAA